jgi:aminoglycoside phosphotransferase (APT) family kinase protein
MERLRRGYTNEVHRVGTTVVKRYRGPAGDERQQREEAALRGLAGLLPVPEIVASADGVLSTAFVDAVHGQELMDTDHAPDVLRTCGRLLRRLQAIDAAEVFPESPGARLVHGDFGPNNLLLSEDGLQARLLVDWEWCATGDGIVDLAWCELIVRLHHAERGPDLSALFDGYGERPRWDARHEAMLSRCATHLEFVRRWPANRSVRSWEERIATVSRWREQG